MMKRSAFLVDCSDESLCCGCRACEQVCSKKAISIKVNAEGFLYPAVDETLCVNCGLCSIVCPIENPTKVKVFPKATYAAHSINRSDRKNSSSGGVFSVIAKFVLEKKGCVYGAAFDENLYLKHVRIVDEYQLPRLMGSKYIQSDVGNCYQQVKKDLNDGLWVYFVGTPCQVAGLKLFLRKDYDLLITSDIVCHGTPSIKIFNVFTNVLEKKWNAKIVDFKFRDKRVNGWSCSCSCVTENERGKRTEHLYDRVMNAYLDAFLSGNMNRECCYKCPFADESRTGDFTLADYWGVKKVFPELDCQDGISVMTMNSEKAQQMMLEMKDNIGLIESNYRVAAQAGGNHQMLTPCVRSEKRDDIYRLAFSDGKSFIESFYRKKELKRKMLFYAKRIVRMNETLYTFLRGMKKKLEKDVLL